MNIRYLDKILEETNPMNYSSANSSDILQNSTGDEIQWNNSEIYIQPVWMFLINGPLTAVIAAGGILTNICCLVVFISSPGRPYIYLYLISLAVWDILLLLNAFLLYCLPSLIYWTPPTSDEPYMYIYPYTLAASAMTFTGTLWSVLALTINQYLALSKPFLYRRIVKNRASLVRNIVAISVSSVIYGIPKFFEWEVVVDENDRLLLKQTAIGRHPVFTIGYEMIGKLLLYSIVPFTVLLAFCLKITLEIQRTLIRRSNLRTRLSTFTRRGTSRRSKHPNDDKDRKQNTKDSKEICRRLCNSERPPRKTFGANSFSTVKFLESEISPNFPPFGENKDKKEEHSGGLSPQQKYSSSCSDTRNNTLSISCPSIVLQYSSSTVLLIHNDHAEIGSPHCCKECEAYELDKKTLANTPITAPVNPKLTRDYLDDIWVPRSESSTPALSRTQSQTVTDHHLSCPTPSSPSLMSQHHSTVHCRYSNPVATVPHDCTHSPLVLPTPYLPCSPTPCRFYFSKEDSYPIRSESRNSLGSSRIPPSLSSPADLRTADSAANGVGPKKFSPAVRNGINRIPTVSLVTSDGKTENVPWMGTKRTGPPKRKKARPVNLMLIALALKFLLSHTLPTILDLVEGLTPVAFFNSLPVTVAVALSNLLVILNSSTNFWVYLKCSERFRTEFLAFFKRKRKVREDGNGTNGTGEGGRSQVGISICNIPSYASLTPSLPFRIDTTQSTPLVLRRTPDDVHGQFLQPPPVSTL